MLACSTGQGKDSFAQQLSDQLGCKVLAPTDLLDIFSNGAIVVENDGELKEFTPNSIQRRRG